MIMNKLVVQYFDLALTLKSGQLFTYKEQNNTFIVQDGNVTFSISQQGDNLTFSGTTKEHVRELFDLDLNVEELHSSLSSHKQLIPYFRMYKGLRLIRQNLRQAILTFILSSNNNQKRIKKMVEHLQEHHQGIFYEEGKLNSLLLKNGNFGYREKYVIQADKMLTKDFLEKIEFATPNQRRELLQTIPGVGPKVADCIMTYSTLRTNNEFPADVWVKRAITKWYNFKKPLTDKNIQEWAKKKFKHNAAYAQQYLFLAAQAS